VLLQPEQVHGAVARGRAQQRRPNASEWIVAGRVPRLNAYACGARGRFVGAACSGLRGVRAHTGERGPCSVACKSMP